MDTTDKNIIQKFSKQFYLEQVFPYLKEKRTQSFITLSLTLLAISIFGIFAINPTLTTIIELRKQLSDAQFVDRQLLEKNTNLSILGQKYALLVNDLPLVSATLPDKTQAGLLLGQINALAEENHIQITLLHTDTFVLTSLKSDPTPLVSFNFSVDANGNIDNLLGFASSLSNAQRLVTIHSFMIHSGEDNINHLTLNGKAYVKK